MTRLFKPKTRDIEKALNSLRPAMEADGGGVDLVSINKGIVNVRLKGTCLMCPSAGMTLKVGIEKSLKERFSWVSKVIRVD